ncbi:hypothetical protein VT99_10692 [Candidatus Electrothrix marina]|uniref:Uncharacterized protein n=1 Tax=Candidatus Electrothrix marina TaxID=1859130 RepID=A0A3S4TEB4_9BACT|nr:hypothetical protein VT99_10692 [Candidatus Electrothrix marina]
MLTSIKILAAAIFIVTGGAVFSEKYRKHGVLAILASIVSVMSAYYLIRSIKDDIVNEVETVAITSNKRADDFLSCENSYLIVTKQDPQCNFGLSDKSELMYNDQITEGSLTVIYENSGLKSARKIPSNMYVVYPQSPSGRYAFIQSCQFEENGIDYGLCWAPFIFDKKSRKIHETSAGKYGPERWINWSSDDRYAILSNKNEGAMWLHAIDATNGKTYSFPSDSPYPTWDGFHVIKIYSDTFAWRGPHTFAI